MVSKLASSWRPPFSVQFRLNPAHIISLPAASTQVAAGWPRGASGGVTLLSRRQAQSERLNKGYADPVIFAPYHATRHDQFQARDAQLKLCGMPGWFGTSIAAPVSERLRTRQSIRRSSNSMTASSETRYRGAFAIPPSAIRGTSHQSNPSIGARGRLAKHNIVGTLIRRSG